MSRIALAARRALPLCLLAALSVATVSLHADRYRVFSPIDELQHLDYVISMTEGHRVAPGEEIGQKALGEEACLGIDAPGFTPPPCDEKPYDPARFQESGYNSAAIHNPPYYVVTAGAAAIVRSLTGADTYLMSSRLAGALWMFLGLAAIWFAGRSFGASPYMSFIGALLAASTLAVIFISSTVNPDAASLLAGGVMLVALFELQRHPTRRRWLWFVLAVVFAMSFKLTNVVIVFAAVVTLCLDRWQLAASTRERLRAVVIPATLSVVAVVGTMVATTLYRPPARPYRDGATFTSFATDSFPFDIFTVEPLKLFPPMGAPHRIPELTNNAASLLDSFLYIIFVVGAAGAVFFAARSRHLNLAAGTCIAALLCAPAFALHIYLPSDSYFSIPSRYGLALLPAFAVLAMQLGTSWWRRAILSGYAFGSVGFHMYVLAGGALPG